MNPNEMHKATLTYVDSWKVQVVSYEVGRNGKWNPGNEFDLLVAPFLIEKNAPVPF